MSKGNKPSEPGRRGAFDLGFGVRRAGLNSDPKPTPNGGSATKSTAKKAAPKMTPKKGK